MKRIKSLYYWIAVVVFGLIIANCLTIDSVVQPETAAVGEEITITVNATADVGDNARNYRLIFGILVPKNWNIRETATVRYDSDWDGGTKPKFPGSGVMFLDDETLSKGYQKSRGDDGEYTGNTWATDAYTYVGTGVNYGKMEWVVFISEQIHTEVDIIESGTITLTLDVGDGHTGTQLGYFLAQHQSGFEVDMYDTFFPDCMAITGTAPGSTDLCGPEPSVTVSFWPDTYSWNDLITIDFDAKVGGGQPTALVGASEVYLCANAVYTGGTSQACDNSAATKMRDMGNDTWQITIWARGLLDIPGDADISEITFNFKNSDGSIVVTEWEFPKTGEDFELVPNCN